MSQFITEAFVQQFADNFKHVAQQTESRFQSGDLEPNIVGVQVGELAGPAYRPAPSGAPR
ncbi:hypothetical protein SNK04_014163 [Fusarium graminearum]